jgi:uncharacterized protein (TIGR02266 family)
VSDDKPDTTATFSERSPVTSPEDREQARFAVDVGVTVDSEHNFYAGLATNLSAGGFFVATHIVHPAGTRFNFTIHLTSEDAIVKGVGVVRWLRHRDAEPGTPAGLGIQFLEIEGDGAEKIASFLAKREPLQPPK